MSNKRKREDQEKKGPVIKKQKTDTNNEARIKELFEKINGIYGGKKFPAVSEEKIDEWEEQIKKKIEEKPNRFKLPSDLRAYWKCIGLKPDSDEESSFSRIKELFTANELNKYEYEAQRDIFSYYLDFLESGAECAQRYGDYEWPEQDDDDMEVAITQYWMDIASDGEYSQIIINCDSSDLRLFGQVYLVISNCGTCQFMCKSVTDMLENLWNFIRDVHEFECIVGGSEGIFSGALAASKGCLQIGKLGDLNTRDEANKDIVAQYETKTTDKFFAREIDVEKRTIIFKHIRNVTTKVATYAKSFDDQNDLFLVKNKYSGFAYRCGIEELANNLKSEFSWKIIQIYFTKSFADQLTYQ